MFTTNLEDGREAPSKARKKGALNFQYIINVLNLCLGECKGVRSYFFRVQRFMSSMYLFMYVTKQHEYTLGGRIVAWTGE